MDTIGIVMISNLPTSPSLPTSRKPVSAILTLSQVWKNYIQSATIVARPGTAAANTLLKSLESPSKSTVNSAHRNFTTMFQTTLTVTITTLMVQTATQAAPTPTPTLIPILTTLGTTLP